MNPPKNIYILSTWSGPETELLRNAVISFFFPKDEGAFGMHCSAQPQPSRVVWDNVFQMDSGCLSTTLIKPFGNEATVDGSPDALFIEAGMVNTSIDHTSQAWCFGCEIQPLRRHDEETIEAFQKRWEIYIRGKLSPLYESEE